jgi:RNA polymerase sigma factor (sigma-70 family)
MSLRPLRLMHDERTGHRFPATSHSLVEAITHADREVRKRALELLVAAYWRPVYSHLRLQWHMAPSDAEDVTQDFFAQLLDKELLARYDQRRARFRTFLRVCLDGFAGNQRRAARRIKRGGEAVLLPLDLVDAEGELRPLEVPDPYDPEARFRAVWVRSLFTEAMGRLQREYRDSGKDRDFQVFERYDLTDRPGGQHVTYADLGRELGLTATQVNNYLAAARHRLREIVLEHLRAICVSEAEFRAEVRDLFAGESG